MLKTFIFSGALISVAALAVDKTCVPVEGSANYPKLLSCFESEVQRQNKTALGQVLPFSSFAELVPGDGTTANFSMLFEGTNNGGRVSLYLQLKTIDGSPWRYYMVGVYNFMGSSVYAQSDVNPRAQLVDSISYEPKGSVDVSACLKFLAPVSPCPTVGGIGGIER